MTFARRRKGRWCFSDWNSLPMFVGAFCVASTQAIGTLPSSTVLFSTVTRWLEGWHHAWMVTITGQQQQQQPHQQQHQQRQQQQQKQQQHTTCNMQRQKKTITCQKNPKKKRLEIGKHHFHRQVGTGWELQIYEIHGLSSFSP